MGRCYLHHPPSLAMKQYVALIDCNNFYASCEQVFNPTLRNKPLIILSNNDGCIIARSNEAKRLGIRMGEPFFKCKPIIEKNNVQVFSSNYTLYADMSSRVMTIIRDSFPKTEIYSIDEAFVYFAHSNEKSIIEEFSKLRERILKWTGIPVSIGISTTKTLAKVANKIAKKEGGISTLVNDDKLIEPILKEVEVGEIWGIGNRLNEFLTSNGISNALELKEVDYKWIRKKTSINVLKTVMELNGFPCIELKYAEPNKKQIITSRAFASGVLDFNLLEEGISTYISRAAEKLREQDSLCSRITVAISTNKFDSNLGYIFLHDTILLEQSTNSTSTLIHHGINILKKIFKKGLLYKKGHVFLAEIQDSNFKQFTFNDNLELIDKEERLMKVIDKINNHYGKNTLKYSITGVNQAWITKRTKKSKHFTTNWNELLTISI